MGVGTVAIFSVLLAAIPLTTFFGVLHGRADILLATLLGQSQVSDSARLAFAGIIGVVSVNLVVAAFIVAAWREPTGTPPTEDAKKEN